MKVYYCGLLTSTSDLNEHSVSRTLYSFYIHGNNANLITREEIANKLFESKYWKYPTYRYRITSYLENLYQKSSNREKIPLDNKEIKQILLDVFFKDYKQSDIVGKVEEYIIYEQFYDSIGNIYGKEIITGCIFPIYESELLICFNDYGTDHIIRTYMQNVNHNEKLIRAIIALVPTFPANQSEIDEYLNKKRIKKKKFIKRVSTLASKNAFSEEIVPYVEEKTIITREKPSSETKIMENIDYLLSLLESKNQELYQKYREEYDKILESENSSLTNSPLNISSLIALESKIEFAIKYNKNNSNSIIDYLHELKNQYLENILSRNENKTDITIQDIDKITELFLKQKSDYSLTDQRKVLKDITFIYLLELYENKEFISAEELENSYIVDYLKWIMLNIKALKSLNIILGDITIDLNQELSLSNIINIIKNIEFTKIAEGDIKKLVKKTEQIN